MKNIYICLFLLLSLGCKKGMMPDNGNQNPSNNTPIDFELVGVQDVTVFQHDTTELTVELKYLSGTKQNVSLGVNNLLDKYVISFTPATDTPSYFSTLRIITKGADTGTKSFQIVASSSKKTKAYNINVHVKKDIINPAAKYVGTYEELGICTNSNPNHMISANVPQGSFGVLQFVGFWLGGSSYVINAQINTMNNLISIPSQLSNGMTFLGSGTINDSVFNVNYTVTAPFVNESCSVTLTKQ